MNEAERNAMADRLEEIAFAVAQGHGYDDEVRELRAMAKRLRGEKVADDDSTA